jgi:hypothetical protein
MKKIALEEAIVQPGTIRLVPDHQNHLEFQDNLDNLIEIDNPFAISLWDAPLINSTNMRLVCCTFLATYDRPILWVSSSSNTAIGIYKSCYSNV